MSRSRVSCSSSFLVRPAPPPSSTPSSSRRRAIDWEMVRQLVSVPPSQRWIHIVLGAALGGRRHRIGGLALGAHEQHPPAGGGDFAHLDQRLMQQRDGLGEVDDVDVGAAAEDVALHLRVPPVGLVAEVGASFQELSHANSGSAIGSPVHPAADRGAYPLRYLPRLRGRKGGGRHRTAVRPRSACEIERAYIGTWPADAT